MPKTNHHYFFKVFFPDQSACRLSIPPAFQKHIRAGSGQQVSLKGPSGSVWRVNLAEGSDGFSFGDGWAKFVSDQSLGTGDFLIFQYDGRSEFKVLVFDTTACEKKMACLVRPSGEGEMSADGKKEPGGEVSTKKEEEEDDNQPLIHLAKKQSGGTVKRKWGKSDRSPVNDRPGKEKEFQSDVNRSHSNASKQDSSHLNKDLIIPKQEDEPCLPSSSSKYEGEKTVEKIRKTNNRDSTISVGLKTINKQTNVVYYHNNQVGTSSPLSIEKIISKKSNISLQHVKSNEAADRRNGVNRVGSLISQRRDVTEEEVRRTLEKAMSFSSEHPFALAVMRPSYVYATFYMALPTWFAKQHLPRRNTVLTVWDPTEKPWKINYIAFSNRGALSGGWAKFSYANNLEQNDVCVFELIQEKELKVHVYRVVEQLTPLITRRHFGDEKS